MTTTTKECVPVQIMRAAYMQHDTDGSTLFVTTRPETQERLEACLRAIGPYNRFHPEGVINAFREYIAPHVPDNYFRTMFDVGREYSPVLYIHMPARLNDDPWSLDSDEWEDRCRAFAEAAGADEYGPKYGSNPKTGEAYPAPRTYRVWWD